jgi:hypothetical protein
MNKRRTPSYLRRRARLGSGVAARDKLRLTGPDGERPIPRVPRDRAAAGADRVMAAFLMQDIDEFSKEAARGNYDHLLRTAMRWFSCE